MHCIFLDLYLIFGHFYSILLHCYCIFLDLYCIIVIYYRYILIFVFNLCSFLFNISHLYSIFSCFYYKIAYLHSIILFVFNLCSLLFYKRLFIFDFLHLYSIVKAQQNLHNDICALLGLWESLRWDLHIGAGRMRVEAMMNGCGWVDGLG